MRLLSWLWNNKIAIAIAIIIAMLWFNEDMFKGCAKKAERKARIFNESTDSLAQEATKIKKKADRFMPKQSLPHSPEKKEKAH